MKNLIVILAVIAGFCSTARADIMARAELSHTEGQTAGGVVNFDEIKGHVRVSGKLTGLSANSVHAIHIHDNGDCSGPKAEAAGAHFNPAGKRHGGPNSDEHHSGDMGNIRTNKQGIAEFSFITTEFSLTGGATSQIINRSMVLHKKEDDLVSQPAGNSGSRIACGIIRIISE
ncbi:MAG: hypothetical protein A2901_06000 [Elusimicrobia bacterium RIFCSPLOWO2_01_FULL_54_10]|nr:MAG: hypothetical protein A2901_06000 [Elusimicrobia bacterium RIFCSPLOWO2_01_FULL_54_10]